jgi:hypothetical protein
MFVVRLGMSCGLHAIPSSEFVKQDNKGDKRDDPLDLLRSRTWAILPPEDPVELGERIWAL